MARVGIEIQRVVETVNSDPKPVFVPISIPMYFSPETPNIEDLLKKLGIPKMNAVDTPQRVLHWSESFERKSLEQQVYRPVTVLMDALMGERHSAFLPDPPASPLYAGQTYPRIETLSKSEQSIDHMWSDLFQVSQMNLGRETVPDYWSMFVSLTAMRMMTQSLQDVIGQTWQESQDLSVTILLIANTMVFHLFYRFIWLEVPQEWCLVALPNLSQHSLAVFDWQFRASFDQVPPRKKNVDLLYGMFDEKSQFTCQWIKSDLSLATLKDDIRNRCTLSGLGYWDLIVGYSISELTAFVNTQSIDDNLTQAYILIRKLTLWCAGLELEPNSHPVLWDKLLNVGVEEEDDEEEEEELLQARKDFDALQQKHAPNNGFFQKLANVFSLEPEPVSPLLQSKKPKDKNGSRKRIQYVMSCKATFRAVWQQLHLHLQPSLIWTLGWNRSRPITSDLVYHQLIHFPQPKDLRNRIISKLESMDVLHRFPHSEMLQSDAVYLWLQLVSVSFNEQLAIDCLLHQVMSNAQDPKPILEPAPDKTLASLLDDRQTFYDVVSFPSLHRGPTLYLSALMLCAKTLSTHGAMGLFYLFAGAMFTTKGYAVGSDRELLWGFLILFMKIKQLNILPSHLERYLKNDTETDTLLIPAPVKHHEFFDFFQTSTGLMDGTTWVKTIAFSVHMSQQTARLDRVASALIEPYQRVVEMASDFWERGSEKSFWAPIRLRLINLFYFEKCHAWAHLLCTAEADILGQRQELLTTMSAFPMLPLREATMNRLKVNIHNNRLAVYAVERMLTEKIQVLDE